MYNCIFITVLYSPTHSHRWELCVGSELAEHTKDSDRLGSADWMITRQTTNQIHCIAKPISIGGSDYTPTPITLVGWGQWWVWSVFTARADLFAHRHTTKLQWDACSTCTSTSCKYIHTIHCIWDTCIYTGDRKILHTHDHWSFTDSMYTVGKSLVPAKGTRREPATPPHDMKCNLPVKHNQFQHTL